MIAHFQERHACTHCMICNIAMHACAPVLVTSGIRISTGLFASTGGGVAEVCVEKSAGAVSGGCTNR